MGGTSSTPQYSAQAINPVMNQIYNSSSTRYAQGFTLPTSTERPETTAVTTTRVQLDSYLDKASIHFKLKKSKCYEIEFVVSTTSGCVVQVHYIASEDASGRIVSQLPPVTLQLPPGKDHHISGETVTLDLSAHSDSMLQLRGPTYPIGILIVKAK